MAFNTYLSFHVSTDPFVEMHINIKSFNLAHILNPSLLRFHKLSITKPFVHQGHPHPLLSVSRVGVKVSLMGESSGPQCQCKTSQTLCIVDVVCLTPGGTEAFLTDLECLCCGSIRLYHSAVSASSQPTSSHEKAAAAVSSSLVHL